MQRRNYNKNDNKKGYVSIELKKKSEKLNVNLENIVVLINIHTLSFHLDLISFESMLSKCLAFLQLGMCFTLLKKLKIAIINAAVAIKIIVIVSDYTFPNTLYLLLELLDL